MSTTGSNETHIQATLTHREVQCDGDAERQCVKWVTGCFTTAPLILGHLVSQNRLEKPQLLVVEQLTVAPMSMLVARLPSRVRIPPP
jgi:hypothetical protein